MMVLIPDHNSMSPMIRLCCNYFKRYRNQQTFSPKPCTLYSDSSYISNCPTFVRKMDTIAKCVTGLLSQCVVKNDSVLRSSPRDIFAKLQNNKNHKSVCLNIHTWHFNNTAIVHKAHAVTAYGRHFGGSNSYLKQIHLPKT